ncbi:MAG: PLP-dependent aminotransferase family protein [Pseudomonadota bacterium]
MLTATLSDYLLQRLDRSPGKPVNRQIYRLVREAVLDGVLGEGLQLPSSRELARQLKLSRNTVIYAYEQLLAEGYLASRKGAGTYIARTVPDLSPPLAPPPQPTAARGASIGLSTRGAALVGGAGAHSVQWGAFLPGVPDVTRFPNVIWNRLHSTLWRRSRPEMLSYSSGGGHLPLREAIADYLRVARSVNCHAGQVIITAGIHQSIDLVAKLLADPGERAWVEEPCYWGTHNVLNALNLETVPIPVDADGITFDEAKLRHPPRFIFVTPSHQYPLGSVMSLSRRRRLLEYAAAKQAWIIEDDYDSEFRYNGRPLAALQGMDACERVLYLGSFSKTLFPGLRIGYIVVPEALARAFATGVSELYRGGQVFTQAVLAEFMEKGYFSSHIRRMRILYARRRQLLQDAITASFGERLAIAGGDAGLHLTLLLPDDCDDIAVSAQAQQEGIIARPLSRYYKQIGFAKKGLLLGYAGVPDELIGPCFQRLAAIIKRHLQ